MWQPLITGLLALGRWSEATDLLGEAEDTGVRADLPLLRLELIALRAVMDGLRGDGTSAQSLAESAWSVLDLDENRRLQVLLIRALGLAALGRGEFDNAYRYFRRLFDQEGKPHYPDRSGRALLDLAMTAAQAEEIPDARAVLAANQRPTGAPQQAVVHHATALLTDDAETEARFRAAIDEPGASVWVVDHALARLHYGVWLRRQRRYRDARAQLKPALATFGGAGLDGYATRARTELHASGDDIDEASMPRIDLSPQQRQVALMAAQGLRNKEIAARMLLSPRTIGTHLYNVYLKLGISTRAELRAALGLDEHGGAGRLGVVGRHRTA
jgi:DNA-binding CsgD family transcriptional regulator